VTAPPLPAWNMAWLPATTVWKNFWVLARRAETSPFKEPPVLLPMKQAGITKLKEANGQA
jgi:hypothetical protein